MNTINAKLILNALINAGVNASVIPFLMAQIAHETNGFKSRVLKTDNNASGIMFINKPTKQLNAVKGSRYPANEGKYFYARFNTLNDWAKDYLRVLGKTAQTATSLADFAQKLKNRRYYTDTVKNYTNGLISWSKRIKNILPTPKNESNSGMEAFLAISAVIAIALYLAR